MLQIWHVDRYSIQTRSGSGYQGYLVNLHPSTNGPQNDDFVLRAWFTDDAPAGASVSAFGTAEVVRPKAEFADWYTLLRSEDGVYAWLDEWPGATASDPPRVQAGILVAREPIGEVEEVLRRLLKGLPA